MQAFNQPDRLVVELSHEEVLEQRVYLQTEDGKMMITSITIGEAIKTAAWKLLNIHGKKLMEGREFPGADVVVMDGKFWANFYAVNVKKNLPAPPSKGKPPWEP
jgi:hypothetical protein